MKIKNFTVKINDNDKELIVKSPSLENQREATKHYNQAFSDALKAKAVVRAKLDDLLVEQGLWDNAKQAKFSQLQAEILDYERQLAKGGISLTLAKDIAFKMKSLREDLRDLISVKTNLDTHTAEGQADNARFNYLVSACVYDKDTNQPFFKNYDDYLNRSNEEVAILAAQNLANMLYGLDNDYEANLPENKFLQQYKFIDSKLRKINKEGKLVDDDGRLIDEEGRYINDKGEFVDKNGNLVNDKGNYIVEFQPFLDDDGKPILLETAKEDSVALEPTPESNVPNTDN